MHDLLWNAWTMFGWQVLKNCWLRKQAEHTFVLDPHLISNNSSIKKSTVTFTISKHNLSYLWIELEVSYRRWSALVSNFHRLKSKRYRLCWRQLVTTKQIEKLANAILCQYLQVIPFVKLSGLETCRQILSHGIFQNFRKLSWF